MMLKYRYEGLAGYIYGFINLDQVQTIHFYPDDHVIHLAFGEHEEDRTWILHIENEKFEDAQFFIEEALSHKSGMVDISHWVTKLEVVGTT